MLIGCPKVIITSRSTANDFVNRIAPADLEIEARGLSIASVWDYLRDENFVSAEHAENIHRFVESNEVVLEMIQIPIQLDMLCYGWNDLIVLESYVAHDRDETKASEDLGNDGETIKPPTMTKLYQAIIRRLWRNDIVRLKKSDNGELLTYDIVNAVRDPARLMRVVHHENDLLGELAFMLVRANQLFFTDKDVQCAIRELESRKGPLPLALERNLQALSFIRLEYGEKGLRQYRFIHLTIQEFFAAQYLSQKSTEWDIYLSHFKYSRRWVGIWHFLAGLVFSSRNSSKDIKLFFEMLENEPRDLQGSIHAQLTVNCLAECEWQWKRVEHPLQQGLVADLTAWMVWEYDATSWMQLSKNSRFPEDILESEIRKSCPNNATLSGTSLVLDKMLYGRRVMSERLCNCFLDLYDSFFTATPSDLMDERLVRGGVLRFESYAVLANLSFLPQSIFERLFKYFCDACFNDFAIDFASGILECQLIPGWAQIVMIEILESLHSSRSECAYAKRRIQTRLKRLILAPASCRLLKQIFVQARERGTSPAWVVSLLKSQTRLPPDIVSDLSEYLPKSHQASRLLGWCNEDINKILASQMELDPRTIEKLRHQLQTPNSHGRLDLAISLAGFPALESEILPLLLAAFESAYKNSHRKGFQQVQDIAYVLLQFRQVRTQVFTKLLSHEDISVRCWATQGLRELTDLDDVGLQLFWNLLREVPTQAYRICDFLEKTIHLICEDPVDELLRLLNFAFEKHKSRAGCAKIFNLILTFEEEVKERLPTVEETFWVAMRLDYNDLDRIGAETSRKFRLRPETVELLFELCESGSFCALRALETRVEAVPKALELLQSTTDQTFASWIVQIIASIYVPLPVRKTVVNSLIEQLLIEELPIDAFRELGSNLCAEKTVTFHSIRAWNAKWAPQCWQLLSLTEFCQNINSFDATEMYGIFPSLFTNRYYSTHQDDANYCVWIKGDAVYQESANGISSYPLQSPNLFRRAFRNAQREQRVPKWQLIGVDSEDERTEVSPNH